MLLNQNHYFFVSVITAMASVSLFATDIYLPALPEMAIYFNCTQSAIQSSFTVFLLGLASCQLVAGIISDRFGRKRVLMVGLTIFTISSILCACATTLPQFVVFRMLQAMGGGVGSVISRALVADRFNRQDAVKVFSTVFPIVGLSSAIGPFVGGYLTHFFGWQSTFYFIAGFGFLILITVFFCLTQQKEKTVDPTILKPTLLAHNLPKYVGVLRNLEFLGYVFIISASFCVFRCYTVESPFVFNTLGFGAKEIGHFYIVLSIAYLIGNLTAKKLTQKMNIEKLLQIGMSFFVLGGFCMIVSSLILEHSPYTIIIPMCVITLGNGFLFPVASAGAMTSVSAELIGTASGLMGAIQFVCAAFCVSWIGQLCQGKVIPLSFSIGFVCLIGLMSYLMLTLYRPKAEVTLS